MYFNTFSIIEIHLINEYIGNVSLSFLYKSLPLLLKTPTDYFMLIMV